MVLALNKSLFKTVGDLVREGHRFEIGESMCYCCVGEDDLRFTWRGQIVLTIKNFNTTDEGTTYLPMFDTYVGWKLYNYICIGCFASQPKFEVDLKKGINPKL